MRIKLDRKYSLMAYTCIILSMILIFGSLTIQKEESLQIKDMFCIAGFAIGILALFFLLYSFIKGEIITEEEDTKDLDIGN